jgi:hypothetical protein
MKRTLSLDSEYMEGLSRNGQAIDSTGRLSTANGRGKAVAFIICHSKYSKMYEIRFISSETCFCKCSIFMTTFPARSPTSRYVELVLYSIPPASSIFRMFVSLGVQRNVSWDSFRTLLPLLQSVAGPPVVSLIQASRATPGDSNPSSSYFDSCSKTLALALSH